MLVPAVADPQRTPSDRVPNEETQQFQNQPPPNNPTTGPEIEEIARHAETQPPQNNTTTGPEIEAALQVQTQLTPNNIATASEIAAVAPQTETQTLPSIDPMLLRAIADKDVISLKRILGIELGGSIELIPPVEQNRNANPAPTVPDPEALLHSSIDVNNALVNAAENVLRGVSYGRNNALHIVAGVQDPPPPEIFIAIAKFSFYCNPYLYGFQFIIAPLILFLFRNNMEQGLEIAEIIYRKDPILLRARNHAMDTPLLCAARTGKHRMVALFIKLVRESDPQNLEELLWAKNLLGETALHAAASPNHRYVVKELVDADETLAHLLDNNGTSPLYLAAASGSLNVVQVLTGCDPPVSHLGPDGQTALHAAVMIQGYNGRSIIHEIFKWNPDLATTPDDHGNTPLHYAASIGNSYAVWKMLTKYPDAVYKPNNLGSFPVHLAADSGSFRVINEVLKKCPDVDEILDQKKRNFLHIAVEKGRESLVVSAIRKGILNGNMINAQDKDGNTPLHIAVKSSDLGIFTLLFRDSRVNPNIRNAEALTPLDISASLQDNQFTYSQNPQSIIHHTLLTRGAFRNPCQPVSSKIAGNIMTTDNGANAVGRDIEKESKKYEDMSKSLITGAVLVASAAAVAMFTVSGVYTGDSASHTSTGRSIFKAFVIADLFAFIFAIVSTSWLLYSALTIFHFKYRLFYFNLSIPFLHIAINLFILAFGLGGYIAIVPHCKWLAILILVISGVAIFCNIIFYPKFIPRIQQAFYFIVEVNPTVWYKTTGKTFSLFPSLFYLKDIVKKRVLLL